MSILDLIGTPGMAGQTTATSSLPDGLKSLFAPLMESIIKNATAANDPITRIGNVGRASLDSGPFAKNLAALDTQGTQAQAGAANMFLQVLGMDRQIEESRAQERRFLAGHEIDKRRLEQQGEQFRASTALGERRADIADRRADQTDRAAAAKEAAEIRRRQDDENKRLESDHDSTRKATARETLNPVAFYRALDTDPEYIAARQQKDWNKANKIAAVAAATIGQKTDLPAVLRERHVSYLNVADAVSDLKGLLSKPQNMIDPSDRARIAQAWDKIVLHYGMATGRGANYTVEEMAKVIGIAGQSPTDLRYRSIESIKTYLDRLNHFEGTLSKEIDNLIGSRARPGTDARHLPPGERPVPGDTGTKKIQIITGPDGKQIRAYHDGKRWFNEDGTPLK